MGRLQQRIIALANHSFSLDLKELHPEIPDDCLRLVPTAEDEVNQTSDEFSSKIRSYLSLLSENTGLPLEESKKVERDVPFSSIQP